MSTRLQRPQQKAAVMLLALFITVSASAQRVFVQENWSQKSLVSLSMSQLFYELHVGINLRPAHASADFLYLAAGYGHPTKKNAWRKFLPDLTVAGDLTKEQMDQLSAKGTSGLHSGMIGVGWNHYFNHVWGIYAQVGWGFIADLSTDSDMMLAMSLQDQEEKSTFIYNTVPVELGASLNLYGRFSALVGVTYMWKEIPLLTAGVGYTF